MLFPHRKPTSKIEFKEEKHDSYMFLNKSNLSLFDAKSDWLENEICIWSIGEEVNNIVWNLGGPAKAAKLMNVKYSRLKEWHLGRRPIPLSKLKQLLSLINTDLKQEIVKEIDSKQVYLKCQYSPHTVKFPNKLTGELAYSIGLLLGDGSLRGKNSNSRGNWSISAYFDDFQHLEIYKNHMEKIFEVKTKTYLPKGNYYISHFASKAIQWFLINFFDFSSGYKCDKIKIPERICNSENPSHITSCIKGLFDSDGTVIVTNKRVSFSSTSEIIVDQVIFWLSEFEIHAKKDKWLKNEKYKMLFTARINGTKNLENFKNSIGFKHPEKRKKIYKITEPPILQIAP